MNLSSTVRTVRWMVRDTFRQAVATKLFWVLFGTAAVATLFCLSVRVAGDPPPVSAPGDFPGLLPASEAAKAGPEAVEISGARVLGGEMTLGFGAVKVPLARGRVDAVRQLQLLLVGVVADTAGVLLALLWTAGFLPTFLEPQAASVLLAKPAPRWAVLVGKYVGVVLFVGLFAGLFVAGTWAGLGISTGVWTAAYWLAVPLLTVNFAVFYAVSAFLAVWTRSTVASAFGTLAFWLVCFAANYARHHMVALPPDQLSPAAALLTDIGYWVLPKPLDYAALFFDAMHAGDFAAEFPETRAVRAAGELRPELALGSGVLFAAATLGLASYEFEATDY